MSLVHLEARSRHGTMPGSVYLWAEVLADPPVFRAFRVVTVNAMESVA